jgi:general secretion pathway protein B
MSFILDALKKSETDRQRQNGPALFEVKVAPPRNGLPLWAIGLAVLLAVNLVIVAWVLLRRPAATAEVSATTAQAQPAAPGQPLQPPPPMTTYQQPQGYGSQGSPPQQQAPVMPQSGMPGAPQGQAMAPGQNTAPVSGTAPTSPVGQTAGMTQSAPGNDGAVAQGGAVSEKVNPDDYAPATDAGPAAPFGNHVSKTTSSGVPLYQDASLAPGAHIPELRLDLHVFAAKPQERFVMINMHKLHEGDTLPEGVHVESITPEGAVLSKDGTRFLLPRD